MMTSNTVLLAAVGLSQLAGGLLLAQAPSAPVLTGGGSFEVARAVEFVSETGEILYTTDGTDPTLQSPVASEPLVLTESARIRARAAVNGVLGPIRETQVVNVDQHWLGYDCDGDSPQLTDSSGARRDGVMVGAARVAEGRLGGGLDLPGGSARVELGTVELPATAATFAAWFKPTRSVSTMPASSRRRAARRKQITRSW